MAHFAELDENNNVVNVIVVASEDFQVDGVENEEAGINLLEEWFGHRRWAQTSYSDSIRGRYATIGGVFRPDLNQFIGLKPFPSWLLNETTGEWEAPSPRPALESNQIEYWDEENLRWSYFEVTYPEPGDPDYVEYADVEAGP